MTLATMQPDPTWDETANSPTVDAFAAVADRLAVHIWGGDWCGDCRRELPALAAALAAADIPEDRIHVHIVDREKEGDLVEEYDVTQIPTIVLKIDGGPVARFEERESRPAPVYLAGALEEYAA